MAFPVVPGNESEFYLGSPGHQEPESYEGPVTASGPGVGWGTSYGVLENSITFSAHL